MKIPAVCTLGCLILVSCRHQEPKTISQADIESLRNEQAKLVESAKANAQDVAAFKKGVLEALKIIAEKADTLPNDALRLKLDELKTGVQNIQKAGKEIGVQLEGISNRLTIDEATIDDLKKAQSASVQPDYFPLSVAEPTANPIKSYSGIFYCSVEKVEPYLDGQKLTLRIINGNAVSFLNTKVDLFYSNGVQTGNKTVSLMGDLKTGGFIETAVYITDLKPSNIQSLYAKITTGGISYRPY